MSEVFESSFIRYFSVNSLQATYNADTSFRTLPFSWILKKNTLLVYFFSWFRKASQSNLNQLFSIYPSNNNSSVFIYGLSKQCNLTIINLKVNHTIVLLYAFNFRICDIATLTELLATNNRRWKHNVTRVLLVFVFTSTEDIEPDKNILDTQFFLAPWELVWYFGSELCRPKQLYFFNTDGFTNSL